MQHLLMAIIVTALFGCSATTKKDDANNAEQKNDLTYQPYSEKRAPNLTPSVNTSENVILNNATIITAENRTLKGGSIWLKDGKIAQISETEIKIEGATVIDATGKFITPGIIDTHSHMGVYASIGVRATADGNEATNKSTPHVDALNSVWPQDPGFEKAVQAGVTVAQILPGSANLVGGNGVVVQMHPAISARAMLLEEAPKTIKMACGENPKRVYGERGGPGTRMGTYAAFRDLFEKATDHMKSLEAYEKKLNKWKKDGEDETKKPDEPKRNFGQETLVSVLKGETLVQIHCYRADEMVQLLQLSDEFGFTIRAFHHAIEAYKIRDILAKWNVGVSTWADWWGFKLEAHDATIYNAALLSEAGVMAVVHSDSAIGIQHLNQEAAKIYFAGKKAGLDVSENDALRWITYNAAWTLGIEKITGTLKEGKRADLVVWSKHPFSVYAQPDYVFVEGVREFDRQQPNERWSDFETGYSPMIDTNNKGVSK